MLLDTREGHCVSAKVVLGGCQGAPVRNSLVPLPVSAATPLLRVLNQYCCVQATFNVTTTIVITPFTLP